MRCIGTNGPVEARPLVRSRLGAYALVLGAYALWLGACVVEEDGRMSDYGDRFEPADDPRFAIEVVDDNVPGPAFATIIDVEGDGTKELLISAFGKGSGIVPGELRLYHLGPNEQGEQGEQGEQSWSHETIVDADEDLRFINHATAEDIDHDGDLDYFVPHGFLACALPFIGPGHCGGLRWYETVGEGEFVPHVLVPNGSNLFYHVAEFVDFDGDGIEDLVTVAEQKRFWGFRDRAITQWFKGNDSPERFESTPREIGPGMGSLLSVRDVDGDGDLDIASAEFFARLGASFAWYERVADPSPESPAGEFVRHEINDDSGPSIQLTFVEDLFGDGVLRAVGANHTNTAKFPADPWESAVVAFEIPEDPREPWPKTQLSTGIRSRPGSFNSPQAAPGIFGTGDMDNDGDIDIIVSGDGDPNVYWLEQVAPGEFETHVLMEDMGQAGAMQIDDFDGDGTNEALVSSYERDALYIVRFMGE
ncbi:MAG: VCBS repeat-containing protein [Myxococcota bacterium]